MAGNRNTDIDSKADTEVDNIDPAGIGGTPTNQRPQDAGTAGDIGRQRLALR